MTEFSIRRATTVFYFIKAMYRFSKHYWQELKLTNQMNKFFGDLIPSMKLRSLEKDNNNEGEQKKLIDFLLDEKNNFESNEIVDQVKTTVFAVRLGTKCINHV
jgi:hypothetical protein